MQPLLLGSPWPVLGGLGGAALLAGGTTPPPSSASRLGALPAAAMQQRPFPMASVLGSAFGSPGVGRPPAGMAPLLVGAPGSVLPAAPPLATPLLVSPPALVAPATLSLQPLVPAAAPPAAAAAWYQNARLQAHDIQRRNWQPSTNKQRERVWQEMDQWSLAKLGKPAVLCSPDDVVVYLRSHYLEEHGRQERADGGTRPAPSSLATTVAHLSTRFAELGRRGDWDPATRQGNPCLSMEVRTFKGGYANMLQEEGYSPTSAKPISEAKLQRLVSALDQGADRAQQQQGGPPGAAPPPHVELLLRRDACMAQLLWDCMRRPAEVGSLAASSVQVSGDLVTAQAVSSKMTHANRGNRRPRPIEVAGAAGARLAALLQKYEACLQRSGQQLGPFMFSPLRPDGRGLQTNKGLSSSAMGNRLVQHLQRLGLYAGESLYSIKRGSMQHAYHVEGRSLATIGEAADVETPQVVQLYLDPNRHL